MLVSRHERVDAEAPAVCVWWATWDMLDACGPRLLGDTWQACETRRRSAHAPPRLLARRFLGRVLAWRLGVSPGELAISTTDCGRPILCGEGASGPSFNMTHTDAVVAVAVSSSGQVGLDAEIRHRVPRANSLARRVLASDERAQFSAWPDRRRDESFAACWVRKEAVAKALGYGLTLDFASFSVTLPPSPPRVLAAPQGTEVRQWQMHELVIKEDHASVLALLDGPIQEPVLLRGVP
jgi:phosphopantetheinyl transferase